MKSQAEPTEEQASLQAYVLITYSGRYLRDVTQNVCHSSVLLTFLYVKRVEIVKWNM